MTGAIHVTITVLIIGATIAVIATETVNEAAIAIVIKASAAIGANAVIIVIITTTIDTMTIDRTTGAITTTMTVAAATGVDLIEEIGIAIIGTTIADTTRNVEIEEDEAQGIAIKVN